MVRAQYSLMFFENKTTDQRRKNSSQTTNGSSNLLQRASLGVLKISRELKMASLEVIIYHYNHQKIKIKNNHNFGAFFYFQ